MQIITNSEAEELVYDLTREAQDFLSLEYNESLDIPIEINGRLKRALGRYISNRREGIPYRIELSKTILANGFEKSWEVLKHELIHYVLHIQGIPNRDSDEEFIRECKKHGAILTKEFGMKDLVMKRAVIECKGCGLVFTRLQSLPKTRVYTHRGCGGYLVNKGHEIS